MRQNIFEEVCHIFFPGQQFRLFDVKNGVNNWVKGLSTAAGEFIIRVYNNGKDVSKVKVEHQTLQQFQSFSKSFKTPVYLKVPGSYSTVAVLKQGQPAAVAIKIEGVLPTTFQYKLLFDFGSKLAELAILLQNVKLSGPPVILPYKEIYKVHHAVSRQVFFKEVQSSRYDQVREQVTYLSQRLVDLQKDIDSLGKELPVQLIHGDMHFQNILVEGSSVVALLDFQFVSYDWRTMDLAIGLSKFITNEDALNQMAHVLKGYDSLVKMTKEQRSMLPSLLVLRNLSNFVYFVGRTVAGEESLALCIEKARVYCKRLKVLVSLIPALNSTLELV